MFVAVVAAFGLLGQAAVATVIVQNGDFEAATTSAGGVYTNPFAHDNHLAELTVVPDWTFGASTGSTYDGVVAGYSHWGAPVDGTRAAFVEELGSFSQDLSGFAAGTLTVSFYASGPTVGNTQTKSSPT